MRSPIFAALALAVLCVASTAFAQIPGAKLDYVFPASAQAGNEVELSVDGRDLNRPLRLEFSHPGIKGEPVMSPGDAFIGRPQWQRNRFKVTVAPEVPPGVYRTWFVGEYGASNARAFVVGDLPQPAEITGNDAQESAAEIALNSVVVGRVDAGKADWFKIALQPGRKLVIDCQAKSLGSRLDAHLTVYDAGGRQLASRRAAGDLDPVLVFDPPSEGTYFVELSDFLSAGGADRIFRLVVSDRPFIRSVFPPAALPGSKARFRIGGANLPGAGAGGDGEIEVEIDISSERTAVRGGGALALAPREFRSTGAVYQIENSNSVRIPFATAPVVVEDAGATEQPVVPPCEIAGHLGRGDDADTFVFDAAKGETWMIEGISHRSGHPSDLHFTVSRIVVDAEGQRSDQRLAEADDDTANAGGRRAPTDSRDPTLAFTAPEDGRYLVRLIDQFQLDDPSAAYRLAIRRPAPDFALLAEIENPMVEGNRLENWSPSLLRGGRIQIGVMAVRRDGFDGEIGLRLDAAPPGVVVDAGVIEKGKNSGVITLSGTGELARSIGDLKVVGKSGEIEHRAFAVGLVNEVGDFNNEVVLPQLGEQLRVATADSPAPVSVSAEIPPTIETSLGGSIELPLKLAKDGNFNGNAKFYLQGLPNVAQPAAIDLDLNKVAEGKLVVELKPSNENKYAPGRYDVVVRGDVVLQQRPDPLGVAEAGEDQAAIDARVAEAGEALGLAEAKRGEIAQAGLTDDEKAKQSALADEAIKLAQEQKQAAEAARGRAAEAFKEAEARNAPRDLRLAAYSNSFVLDIAAAPLRFKETAAEISVAQGGSTDLTVGFERLFGFADAVEISLTPPEDLEGFELGPVSIAGDQSIGTLKLGATAEAGVGEHAFTLIAKATFNGVNCALQQPVKVIVTTAAAPETNP